MEATSVYPNAVPVLAATGLGVTLAGSDPDHIPLKPNLLNDSRRRYERNGCAVDACGVMRLHVRNALGYSFLRPYQRNKLQRQLVGKQQIKKNDWKAQASYYRMNYRDFVPHDLMMDFLENECPPQEDCYNLSKWQGNAISGVDCGQDGHVVFYPTGHVLQQACAWYSKGESDDGSPCSSTVIETGAPIRQFAVLGSRDAYHSTATAKVLAVARGNTFCTIIAAPARVTQDNMRKLQAKAKISFFETVINHVTGSPHTEAELAVVTVDGTVYCWDPEGEVQNVKKDVCTPDRILRCEYSSHPCVLWAANRVTVSTLDRRESPEHASDLFDVRGAGAFVTIYDVKRRASNPFQFVVGTSVAIEVLDSRMARQPLLSWLQPQKYSGELDFSFGMISEVEMSRNMNDLQGFIISSSKRPKVTTLFPFERTVKGRGGIVMSLTPLRSSDDDYSDMAQSSTEQLVAADATLDLRMEDGGEYTHLTGVCALRDRSSEVASIYQLNSLGDLFSHRVSFKHSQTKAYHTAVQPDLPSGVTAQNEFTHDTSLKTLPIAVDAILPEHDTESMQTFTALPLKVLRRQFPRLPKDKEREKKTTFNSKADHLSYKVQATGSGKGRSKDTIKSQASQKIICRFQPSGADTKRSTQDTIETSRSKSLRESDSSTGSEDEATTIGDRLLNSYDTDELVRKLSGVCDPPASLFQLHRFLIDRLKIELSSTELLLFLRSRNEFRTRTVHHSFLTNRLRVLNPSLPGADDVHFEKKDPRILACTCCSSSQLPCQSWSCKMPHAIIVSKISSDLLLDDTAPSSAVMQNMPHDLADVITAAQAVYDDMNDFDQWDQTI